MLFNFFQTQKMTSVYLKWNAINVEKRKKNYLFYYYYFIFFYLKIIFSDELNINYTTLNMVV